MSTTAAQVRNNLNTIAATIANSRANLDQCKTISAQTEQALTDLGNKYATMGADIDALIAQSPGNAYYASAKAEFNAMVAEFNALKASSTQMKNATAAINY
jgi:hypothetical protein